MHTSVLLALGRQGSREDLPGEPLAAPTRAVLAVVAGLLGALALALWVEPTVLAQPSPFDLPPLGGRLAGSWIALLAVLAGWVALRNRREEARVPLIGLISLQAGMLVAALRTLSDLEPGGATIAYFAAIGLLLATGALLAFGGVARRALIAAPNAATARREPAAPYS